MQRHPRIIKATDKVYKKKINNLKMTMEEKKNIDRKVEENICMEFFKHFNE